MISYVLLCFKIYHCILQIPATYHDQERKRNALTWSCRTYVLADPHQGGLYAILLKLYCDSELKKNSKCIIFNMNLEVVVTMFIFNYWSLAYLWSWDYETLQKYFPRCQIIVNRISRKRFFPYCNNNNKKKKKKENKMPKAFCLSFCHVPPCPQWLEFF